MTWPPQGGWYVDGEPVGGPLDGEEPYDPEQDQDYDDDRNEWWYRHNDKAATIKPQADFFAFEAELSGAGEEGTNFGNLGEAYDSENHPGGASGNPGGSGAHGNVYDVSDYPTYDRTYHMQETQNDPEVASNPFTGKAAVVDSSTGTVLALCEDRAAALRARTALVGGSPFLGATIQVVAVEENPGR